MVEILDEHYKWVTIELWGWDKFNALIQLLSWWYTWGSTEVMTDGHWTIQSTIMEILHVPRGRTTHLPPPLSTNNLKSRSSQRYLIIFQVFWIWDESNSSLILNYTNKRFVVILLLMIIRNTLILHLIIQRVWQEVLAMLCSLFVYWWHKWSNEYLLSRIMRLSIFNDNDKVLLLGEGNFSFSTSLCKHNLQIIITSTCYECSAISDEADGNVKYLENHGSY